MSGLFASCLGCCAREPSRKHRGQNGDPFLNVIHPEPVATQTTQYPLSASVSLARAVQVPMPVSRSGSGVTRTRSLYGRMRIQSTVSKQELKVCGTLPETTARGLYKYSCPVCFRYFSRKTRSNVQTFSPAKPARTTSVGTVLRIWRLSNTKPMTMAIR